MQINNISQLPSYRQEMSFMAPASHETVRKPPARDAESASVRDPAFSVGEVTEAMEMAKERLKDTGLNIRLSSGDGKKSFQVEIFNPETNEVIRRFPPDEIIKLAASIKEMNGFVLDKAM